MPTYQKLHHCVYLCDYHLILPTKYRRNIFNPGLFAHVKRKLLEIHEHYPTIIFKEINHDTDNIRIQKQISLGFAKIQTPRK